MPSYIFQNVYSNNVKKIPKNCLIPRYFVYSNILLSQFVSNICIVSKIIQRSKFVQAFSKKYSSKCFYLLKQNAFSLSFLSHKK